MSRIDRVKSTLTSEQVVVLCRQWLPRGKRQGGWYTCLSPFRNEGTPSFGVSLRGPHFRWKDFGSGDSGDIIDLCMKLHGATLAEAIEAFEQMLGIESGTNRSAKGSNHKSERRAGGSRKG